MITLTEKAYAEVVRLRDSVSAPEIDPAEAKYLKVMVLGGGCSGMSYKLDFSSAPLTGQEKIFELKEIRVVVDPKSYLFLQGTELDFSDGLNGKGFVFNNPNAKRSCGCGNSFSA